MSKADRLAEARRRKAEDEEMERKAKEAEVEEKKRLTKERKAAAKKAAAEAAKDYEEFDGKIFCTFCGDLVEKSMMDDHSISHPAEIRARLFLGAAEHATTPEVIARCGITHILNCTHEIVCPKHVAKMLTGFKRVKLSDRVADSILGQMKDALAWVDEVLAQKEHVLLIHCREGKSRSTSYMCGFLMWKSEISFPSAFGMVRSKRSIAMPNPKFFKQLEQLDLILQSERAPESELKVSEMQFPPSKYKYKLKKPTGATLTDSSARLRELAEQEAREEAEARAKAEAAKKKRTAKKKSGKGSKKSATSAPSKKAASSRKAAKK
jgi:protein-tyrosine phosphatase